MINTPWGLLPVADAHVHFFSHRFFASLAEQKGLPVTALAPLLNWQLPAEDPRQLADAWAQELDRQGVAKARLIASVPGDGESVMAAVRRHPERFYGYMMVNPTAPAAVAQVEDGARQRPHSSALLFSGDASLFHPGRSRQCPARTRLPRGRVPPPSFTAAC